MSIYDKLQQGTKNKSQYRKKEKNRKSDKVCRKNKEDIRGSRSSIEKSTEEDEATSRQREKRS